MTDFVSPDDEQTLQRAIQQSLHAAALQMEHPVDEQTTEQIYHEASTLLSHLSHAPITRARLAGTLLVYQIQETERAEVEWFKSQVQQCLDDEEVEGLIESIHRTDAL